MQRNTWDYIAGCYVYLLTLVNLFSVLSEQWGAGLAMQKLVAGLAQ